MEEILHHPTCPTSYVLFLCLLQGLSALNCARFAPSTIWMSSLFPTLAVGLLDFKVDVVLARLEADFSEQPPSIPALQCPTAKYPCSAQLQSIPAVSNHQISLPGPTEKYPCSAQAQSVPGVPHSKVSIFLQRICSAARKTVEGVQGTVTLVVQ